MLRIVSVYTLIGSPRESGDQATGMETTRYLEVHYHDHSFTVRDQL
jgi:hypothetical protein